MQLPCRIVHLRQGSETSSCQFTSSWLAECVLLNIFFQKRRIDDRGSFPIFDIAAVVKFGHALLPLQLHEARVRPGDVATRIIVSRFSE